MKTVCECGLAKCYHDGKNALAYRPTGNAKVVCTILKKLLVIRLPSGPPYCTGYKPRK